MILRVDRATHLALVDEVSVQPPQTLGPSATYVAGVVKLDDGLVLIHDLATFLSAAEAASLDEALLVPASDEATTPDCPDETGYAEVAALVAQRSGMVFAPTGGWRSRRASRAP